MTDDKARFERCLVAGAGAWGTALAVLLARAGARVTLWTRNSAVADEIRTTHTNATYLPGVTLDAGIDATTDPRAVLEADAMLCVIPAQFMGGELARFAEAAGGARLPLALCSKGIEQSTGRLMHEVAHDVWPDAAVAALSGPSFAADVARGLPTAVTFADPDPVLGHRWTRTLAAPGFRPYLTDDLVGTELGGAIKNVLAIACGIVDGCGLGESARAAVMARGFAECRRFAEAKGAKPETLSGLSGLGDIILTCSSRQSRNMSLGVALGQGQTAADILSNRLTVAEGAATAPVLVRLAQEAGVDMPIAAAVTAILSGQASLGDAIDALLARPLRQE